MNSTTTISAPVKIEPQQLVPKQKVPSQPYVPPPVKRPAPALQKTPSYLSAFNQFVTQKAQISPMATVTPGISFPALAINTPTLTPTTSQPATPPQQVKALAQKQPVQRAAQPHAPRMVLAPPLPPTRKVQAKPPPPPPPSTPRVVAQAVESPRTVNQRFDAEPDLAEKLIEQQIAREKDEMEARKKKFLMVHEKLKQAQLQQQARTVVLKTVQAPIKVIAKPLPVSTPSTTIFKEEKEKRAIERLAEDPDELKRLFANITKRPATAPTTLKAEVVREFPKTTTQARLQTYHLVPKSYPPALKKHQAMTTNATTVPMRTLQEQPKNVIPLAKVVSIRPMDKPTYANIVAAKSAPLSRYVTTTSILIKEQQSFKY